MSGQWLRVRAWAACLGVCALSACADSDSVQRKEVAEPQSGPLTGSVTISLSTPPAVKPLSPVITTRNSVFLGAGATVVSGQTIALGASGGGLRAEPDGVLNETWVRGLADLGDRVQVRGTLHATSQKWGNGINPKPPVDANPAFDPANTVAWSVRYPTSGTGPHVTANPPPNPPLAPLEPGQYGDVTVNSQASLTIKSGTYYLRTLKFESQSNVKLDQAKGPVIIYVETGQLALRSAITTLNGAPPDLLIVYLGTTAFAVESLFNGALVAPSAAVTLRVVNGTHTGFFYSKDFQILDAHARVQYRAPLPIVTAATDPSGGGGSGTGGAGGVGPGPNPGRTCADMIRALVPPADVPAALARYCRECPSAVDTDRDKIQDCLDGCPYDPAKTEPGICGCGVSDADNEDLDPFPDCIDQCPKDPNNIAPGQCGCVGSNSLQPDGTRCTDTAGPQANATCNDGVCGTPPSSQPEGGCRFFTWRSSGYWFCPPIAVPPTGGGGSGGGGGAGGTGGGTGASGGSGGSGGSGAGASSTPRTQDEARLACGAKGLSLIRIDSQQENDFIQDLIQQPIWIGANSVTTANTWRWANATNNNGDQFWTGGATGSRVASRFANWLEGSPTSTARCAVMLPDTGLWQAVPCNQARGYICEYRSPKGRDPGKKQPPGMPNLPPTSSKQCISEAVAQLPYAGPNGENAGPAYDALKGQVDALKDDPSGARAGTAFADLPAQQIGPCLNDPLANGVGRGEARDEGRAGCKFQVHPSLTRCMTNAECSGFGSNFVCRSTNESESCSPETETCKGQSRCGTLDCSDPDAYSPEPPCSQVEICGEAGSEQSTTLEPDATPEPRDFNTTALFGGALPSPGPSNTIWGGPGLTDADPPHGPDGTLTGPNHAWCSDKPRPPANGATPAPSPDDGKDGKTNTSKIKFGFRPDLEFRANPGIIAQGETNLDIFAGASLGADVTLDDFLGQSFSTQIFDASIGLGLQRCHIKSTFAVNLFGQTFADPTILGLPDIDSTREELGEDLHKVATQCDEAVARFQLYADRAKKAFRDAQQLLTQYKNASSLGKALQGNLCNAAFAFGSIDEDFPGGPDCADNEPPYVTVGRFLEYYQAPGAGQIARLHQAMRGLHDATAAIRDIIPAVDLGFTGLSRQESETVLSVQFFIGPIPMVLEVDVFARYGIGGGFEMVFKVPTGLVTGEKGPQPVANVSARVVPYAGAGLSAFVGAGVSLGPLKAAIGIEGALTLANISAPIFAGVGLKVEALQEKRIIHSDILDVAMGPDAFHFGVPTALKFYMNYEYGAGVDLVDILAGEINGTLKIKFFWFSRKWRKRIVKFNGFSHHFDLVKGSDQFSSFSVGERVPAVLPTTDGSPDTEGTTTNVASGGPGLGVAETQAPLMVLAPPAPPPLQQPVETVPFNSSAVDSLGYDSLCCSHLNEDCQPGTEGRPQCCPGFACVVEVEGSDGVPPVAKCQPECNKAGDECSAHGNSCCGDLVCGSLGLCQQCGATGSDCAANEECCSGLCEEETGTCQPDPCEGAPACNGEGQACGACGKTCCEGQICGENGTCEPDPCWAGPYYGQLTCTPQGLTCGTCGPCCGSTTGCVNNNCVACDDLSCTVPTSSETQSSECCTGYFCSSGNQCRPIIIIH